MGNCFLFLSGFEQQNTEFAHEIDIRRINRQAGLDDLAGGRGIASLSLESGQGDYGGRQGRIRIEKNPQLDNRFPVGVSRRQQLGEPQPQSDASGNTVDSLPQSGNRRCSRALSFQSEGQVEVAALGGRIHVDGTAEGTDGQIVLPPLGGCGAEQRMKLGCGRGRRQSRLEYLRRLLVATESNQQPGETGVRSGIAAIETNRFAVRLFCRPVIPV